MKKFLKRMLRWILRDEFKELNEQIWLLTVDRRMLRADREKAEINYCIQSAACSRDLKKEVKRHEETILELKKNVKWYREQSTEYFNIFLGAMRDFQQLVDHEESIKRLDSGLHEADKRDVNGVLEELENASRGNLAAYFPSPPKEAT